MKPIVEQKPIEQIVKALAAGAVANLRPNQVGLKNKAIEEAYLPLKAFIRQRYPQVNVDLLDLGPASEGRQQRLAEQLRAEEAGENVELLEQAQHLLYVINEHDPDALWASEIPHEPAHLS